MNFERELPTDSGVLAICEAVREKLSGDGFEISDEEYKDILSYSERKRKLNQKEPNYLPLLLEDEIKNRIFRESINAASLLIMAESQRP